jgi:hypothetical protein
MMNTEHTRRQFTKEQVKERAQSKAAKPSPTIQSEPMAEPKVNPKEVVAPKYPKTSEQRRKADRFEKTVRTHERNIESIQTLSGLNLKQRRHQKRRLRQLGNKLRGKQQP